MLQLCDVGVLVAALAVTLLLFRLWRTRGSACSGEFPKGPAAWPILGHLPLFGQLPHRVFAELGQKQGTGIVGLRLGSRPAIVVSTAAMAKELLLVNDQIFANRPPYEFTHSLFYGYNVGVTFSTYNPHWTGIRKICALELFNAKRLQHLQHVRQDELRALLRLLQTLSNGGTCPVQVGKHLAEMTSNTTARLLHSKTLADVAPELPELIRGLEHHTFPTLGDFIPWVKLFADVLPRRHMKDLHNRLDRVIHSIVEERRQLMTSLPASQLPHDFLQVILSKEEVGVAEEERVLSTQDIKGVLLDILAAGIHTSSVTLEWAMAELLKNPRCLEKLRAEIDAEVGKEKELVTDEDVPKLQYLEKVTKEVFRLHPVVPLLLPHYSSQKCRVGKYTIPKGTHSFVNVWAIGRDAEVWGEKAEVFWPERFDGKETDLKGQHYELLPFGSGRRSCPGIRLGLSVVHVTLANLVRAFDWHVPDDHIASCTDMNEMGGFGNIKAIPLQAIPTPRRPLH